jgi:hypothetical protein
MLPTRLTRQLEVDTGDALAAAPVRSSTAQMYRLTHSRGRNAGEFVRIGALSVAYEAPARSDLRQIRIRLLFLLKRLIE